MLIVYYILSALIVVCVYGILDDDFVSTLIPNRKARIVVVAVSFVLAPLTAVLAVATAACMIVFFAIYGICCAIGSAIG